MSVFLLLIIYSPPVTFANTSQQQILPLWVDTTVDNITVTGENWVTPNNYRLVALHQPTLVQILNSAPLEKDVRPADSATIITLPLPNGKDGRFRIVNSPIMAPGLAARYPQIQTYAGQGIDDPMATVRLDWTPQGFHAMILTPNGAVYIDPYQQNDTTHYLSYYVADYQLETDFTQYPPLDPGGLRSAEIEGLIDSGFVTPRGDQLKTFRLAVAATGEYTAFHGGTVAAGQAAVVTAINRVTGIYEVELAVRLVLVSNNDSVIYTNSGTDPYSNNNPSALLTQNQSNLDSVIGSANYDVGHVFGTGGGGLAALGVVCEAGSKAQGETGSGSPTGDPFWVDYVAHELGHQFGGNHTFNGSSGNCTGGNRNGPTAYEPGSGSTIQAYAGICSPQDLQSNSDPYFHTLSFDEMVAHVTSGARLSCGTTTSTGNSIPTNINANANGANGVTIPANTPFELTGSATDSDGDPLTYNWEQFDLGPSGAPTSPSGNAPIFRSWLATTSPTRTFPRLTDLVNNTTVIGEILPTYSRNLSFRLTVRDNQAGGGGVDYDGVSFSVENTGSPFQVTSPNSAVTWAALTNETVTWDVAGTTATPINCSNVNIVLSTDGGFTYPVTVLNNTPNDGSQTITVPNNPTTTARIRVECANNIFFDISNQNFTITAPVDGFTVGATPNTVDICVGSNAVYTINVGVVGSFSSPVTLSAPSAPTSPTFSPNGNTPPYDSTMTLTGVAVGNYTFDVVGTDGSSNSTTSVNLNVSPTTLGTPSLTSPADAATGVDASPTFSWSAVSGAVSYDIDIATDSGFSNIVDSANVAINSYTTNLSPNTTYFWRVRANNSCAVGGYSSTFSFTTANIACTTYTSTDVPKTVGPNNGTSTSSVVTVADIGTIVDVNVLNLAGTHTYINDLDFNLISPAATAVQIMAQSCDSGDNFNLNLDDAGTGPAPAWPCPPTDGGTYAPSAALSTFNTEAMAGDWTLRIDDNADLDGGQLNGWAVEICYNPPVVTSDFDIAVTPASVDVCQPNDGQFSIDVTTVGGFTDPVTLSVSGIPSGATASFVPNPVNPSPGSSTLTVSDTNLATVGSYPLTITGVGSSGTHTDMTTLNILAGAPSMTTLSTPANASSNVALAPNFTWTNDPAATSYLIEIATDAGFATIVDSATVGTNSYNGATLASSTDYYWRVTAINGCGSASPSAAFMFTTLDDGPAVFCSVPNVAIPDNNPAGIGDTITVANGSNILDLDVALTATHTFVGDLIFVLEHVDTGTVVTLIDRPGVPASTFGCNNDNLDGVADDEGVLTDIENHCNGTNPWVTGTFVPTEALSAFDNESMAGDWTVTVSDNVGFDTGTLVEWCLLPTLGALPPVIDVNPAVLTSTQAADTTTNQTLTIGNNGDQDLIWTIAEEPVAVVDSPAFMSLASADSGKAELVDGAGVAYLENNVGAQVSINKATGAANFVRFDESQLFDSSKEAVTAQADAFFAQHGRVFGIQDATTELVLQDITVDQYGFTHLEYQQMYKDLPVFGAIMRVHADSDNRLTAVNGVFIPDLASSASPQLTADEATVIAVEAVRQNPSSHEHGGDDLSLLTSFDLGAADTQLYLYRAGLLQGIMGLNHLVYEVEVAGPNLREFVYVDAHTGKIVDRFTGVTNALFRRLFEGNTSTQVWQEGDAFPGSLTGDQQNILVASEDSYYFFFNAFSRDSYDGAGAEMQSVNNDPTISCPNANWNGNTTNYCNGVTADDVVAHEWGHAITEYTGGLIYAWQSGALNESYSDIYGETIDLLNGYGNDTGDTNLRTGCSNSQLRWQMGEDASAFGGSIRDMWDPTCDGDPGKVTDSAQYVCTTDDGGGVHTNSGVPNHAYSLLVDGGTFNGQTINGIGMTKAAHIHYHAQVTYQTPTTDFAAHADGLEMACNDLLGVNLEGLSTTGTPAGPSGEIITTADCAEVTKAILAVEFRTEACPGVFSPMLDPNAPALCSAELTPSNILLQDFESGLGSWTVNQVPSNPTSWDARDWTISASLPEGRPGSGAFGTDPIVGDCQTDLDNGIIQLISPVISIPGGATAPVLMAFDHYASMELEWDGGNLKASVNGGAFTLVPGSAFTFNGYNGSLNTAGAGNDNPLAGQAAFTGADGGSVSGSWGQSQLNLSNLGANPGDTVQLRWEVGTDGCNGWDGWYVDDVRVYTCEAAPPVCVSPADVAWLSTSTSGGTTVPSTTSDVTVILDSTGLSSGVYEATLCIDSNDPVTPVVAVPVTMTVASCSAPTAPSTLTIAEAGTADVLVSWNDTGDTAYNVWWDTNPYFMPGDAGAVENSVVGTNSWTHVGGRGDSANNHFYVVTNSCGLANPNMPRGGAFNFDLTAGQ
ncbi:MAG TPA: M4 family metallopeptidase [Anaerolineae bacterium]|nr:M4 family metallopeptidase [Anaerolineae bacterium]